MTHKPVAYTLADGNWTKIAEYLGDDRPRMVSITNTGTAGEVLVAGLHIQPDTEPDPADIGVDLASGGTLELAAVQPGGGQVHAVWAKTNGMSGKVSPTL